MESVSLVVPIASSNVDWKLLTKLSESWKLDLIKVLDNNGIKVGSNYAYVASLVDSCRQSIHQDVAEATHELKHIFFSVFFVMLEPVVLALTTRTDIDVTSRPVDNRLIEWGIASANLYVWKRAIIETLTYEDEECLIIFFNRIVAALELLGLGKIIADYQRIPYPQNNDLFILKRKR
jgi:hypothetical protein